MLRGGTVEADFDAIDPAVHGGFDVFRLYDDTRMEINDGQISVRCGAANCLACLCTMEGPRAELIQRGGTLRADVLGVENSQGIGVGPDCSLMLLGGTMDFRSRKPEL